MTYDPSVGAIESERAVLGTFLQMPRLFPEVRARLGGGECLMDGRHLLIYSTACEIQGVGQQPDYNSVVVRLRGKDLLDQAGGTSYLDELLEPHNCSPNLIEQHVGYIHEAYTRDRMGYHLEAARDSLRSGSPPAEVRNTLVSSMDDLPWDQTPSHGLKFLTISEIFKSSGDIKWTVQSLIPADSVGIVSGESDSGKTWCVLALAISSASGKKWLGLFDVIEAPVLIMDQEMGHSFIGDRLKKLGATDDLPIHIACFQELALETDDGQAKMVEAIRQYHPGLVIVDSMIGAHDCDENSASEIKRVTRGVARIARDEKCVIVFTHHTRKEGQKPSRPGDRLRGSGELKAGIDWHIYIEIDRNNTITCTPDKCRPALKAPAFCIEIQTLEDGSVRLVGIPGTQRRPSKVKMAEAIIRDTLRAAGMRAPRQAILESCDRYDIGEGTTDNALKGMVDRNEISEDWDTTRTEQGGTSNRRVYVLAKG
jgi:hypothetical protein